MDWILICATYVFGDQPIQSLPRVAADALSEGFDSPSLRQLAGLCGNEEGELVRRLFESSLHELGMSLPSPVVAARAIGIQIVKDIVDGRISPYDGARKIWWEVWNKYRNSLGELRVFAGLASEYEDDPTHATEYSEEIVKESRSILAALERIERK